MKKVLTSTSKNPLPTPDYVVVYEFGPSRYPDVFGPFSDKATAESFLLSDSLCRLPESFLRAKVIMVHKVYMN